MNQPKFVFLTNYVFQPRIIRRIRTVQKQGFKIEVFGIGREKYKSPLNFPYSEIAHKKDGSGYFQALIHIYLRIQQILDNEKNKETIIYCFGIIMGLPLLFISTFNPKLKVKFVYEISDIPYGPRKFTAISSILKWLDKKIIKASNLTILTSSGFTRFYELALEPSKLVVLPNKLNTEILSGDEISKSSSTKKNCIRFGFVGAVRSFSTIGRFVKVIGERFPSFEFHFYGESSHSDDFRKLAQQYNNVFWWGLFQNPGDLPSIYSKIDVTIACYDWKKDFNERYLEPNKLYEALFFRTPLVVSQNTYLAERVAEFNCGYAIDPYSDDKISAFLSSLTPEAVAKKSEQLRKIPKEFAVEDATQFATIIRQAADEW